MVVADLRFAIRNEAFTEVIPPLDDVGFTNDLELAFWRPYRGVLVGGRWLDRLVTEGYRDFGPGDRRQDLVEIAGTIEKTRRADRHARIHGQANGHVVLAGQAPRHRDPAVRLSAFVDEFEGLHVRETICSADLAPAAASIGGELERLIVGDRCLYRAIAANEECNAIDETADEPAVPIAKCGGGATTCYSIEADAACPSGFRLDVARTRPAPENTFTTLRCGS